MLWHLKLSQSNKKALLLYVFIFFMGHNMHKNRWKTVKAALKRLSSCGFREPMQIVLDSSFINKLNKTENSFKQIRKIFKHPPKLFITSCEYAKHEKKKDKDFSGQCEIMQCGCTAGNCLKWILRGKNKHHFVIGTVDLGKIQAMKNMRNVPFLNFYNGIISFNIDNLDALKPKKVGGKAKPHELSRLAKLFEPADESAQNLEENNPEHIIN